MFAIIDNVDVHNAKNLKIDNQDDGVNLNKDGRVTKSDKHGKRRLCYFSPSCGTAAVLFFGPNLLNLSIQRRVPPACTIKKSCAYFWACENLAQL